MGRRMRTTRTRTRTKRGERDVRDITIVNHHVKAVCLNQLNQSRHLYRIKGIVTVYAFVCYSVSVSVCVRAGVCVWVVHARV